MEQLGAAHLRNAATAMQNAADLMDLLRIDAEGLDAKTKKAARVLRAEASGLRDLAGELETKRGGAGA